MKSLSVWHGTKRPNVPEVDLVYQKTKKCRFLWMIRVHYLWGGSGQSSGRFQESKLWRVVEKLHQLLNSE